MVYCLSHKIVLPTVNLKENMAGFLSAGFNSLLTVENGSEVFCFFLPDFQRCARGYHRVNVSSDMYLGKCEPCNCNGHTDDCDPATGQCLVSHLAGMGLVLFQFLFDTCKLIFS